MTDKRLLTTKFLLALGVVCLASCPVFALEPARALTQYTLQTWTSEDGLPQNSVLAIAQAADGYLWVGTQQGLARFDGVRFVPFELVGADGRRDGYVDSLYVDGDVLWVATPGGLYFGEGGSFKEMLQETGGSVADGRTIFRDSSGVLWVGTTHGLFQVENGEARMHSLEGRWVQDIDEYGDQLCVASATVLCWEDSGWQHLQPFPSSLDKEAINHVVFDSSGALWAAPVRGNVTRLVEGELENLTMSEDFPAGRVSAMEVDNDGNVWISFRQAGVVRVGMDDAIEIWRPADSLPGVEIQNVFPDSDGNIWFGTILQGLACLKATPFRVYSVAEGLREASVSSVLEDHRGTVWIGTAGGGLHRLVDGVVSADQRFPAMDVLSLAEDSQGRLWVGTANSGVFLFEGDRFRHVEDSRSLVFSLFEDRRGRLWAGSLQVIQSLVGGRFQDDVSFTKTNAVWIADRADEVWFADAFGGVLRWRDGDIDRLGVEHGLPNAMIVSLHEDEDGGMWVGSHLGGLTLIDGEQSFTFTTEHGLCDNSIFSITEDHQGRLWMTSNLGVFAVDREQLQAVARGQVAEVDCRLFGTADGLRSNECNGGQQPSASRDRAGNLWFATVDGVATVDPERILDTPPPILVEEIIIDGVAYDPSGDGRQISVPPGRGELSVRFTALDFRVADQLQFRYRLEGFDDEWTVAGKRERLAHYTSLPPDSYQLHVQNRLPGAPWVDSDVDIRFRLRPRFVNTPWFLLVLAMAVAALAGAVQHGRVTMLRRRQRQLEEVVADRTRELADVNVNLERRVEEGIGALRESERMAAYGHLVAGVAHEVRHPIFALRAVAHLLSQKLGSEDSTAEELDILERETGRMNQLVDDLLELGRPREMQLSACDPGGLIDEAMASIAANPDISLKVETAVEPSLPCVDADRGAVVQVVLNLVHNACRHAAGASRVRIAAQSGIDSVKITVSDDGAGISLEDRARIFEPFYSGAGGTGLGLAIAHRLVREQGGKLKVSSTVGEGTDFTIELPFCG